MPLLAALAALVTLRHVGNFVRIRAGTEHRAGERVPLEKEVMERVAVLGDGAWGTALSMVLVERGAAVIQ